MIKVLIILEQKMSPLEQLLSLVRGPWPAIKPCKTLKHLVYKFKLTKLIILSDTVKHNNTGVNTVSWGEMLILRHPGEAGRKFSAWALKF